MDYNSKSKKELITIIEAQQRLISQLMEEQNQNETLDFAWSGNLGHWYWDYKTNQVTFNPMKIEALGYSLNEIHEPIGFEFFTSKLHPDDYNYVMNNMIKHLQGLTHVYDVEYRIMAKDGSYKWFHDRGAVTVKDEDGKPLFLAGIVFDISQQKVKLEQLIEEKGSLAEDSIIDEKTKALNYRGLIQRLKTSIQQTDSISPTVILMLDIDDFKAVNDTYGHIIGDQVLIDMVSIIKRNLREEDFIGRFGGEEFIVGFENTPLEVVKNISNRLLEAVANHRFTNGIKVTFSGGIASYLGTSLYDFIHYADINLYEAKRRGKNQII